MVLLPGSLLPPVEFSPIENIALENPPVRHLTIFDNAPGEEPFAVLKALFARRNMTCLEKQLFWKAALLGNAQGGRSALQALLERASCIYAGLRASKA